MIEIGVCEEWCPRELFIGMSLENYRKFENSGFIPAGTIVTNKLEIAVKYGGVLLVGNVIFNNLEPYKNSRVIFVTQIDVPMCILQRHNQKRRPLEFFYKFCINR